MIAGAQVPFLRIKKLSGSNVTIKDTLIDCIHRIKSENVKYHFCLFPASILISPNDLRIAFVNIKKKLNSLIAVNENKTFYRSFIKKRKYVEFVWKKNAKKMSQQLQPAFSDSGTFFVFKTKEFLKSKNILLNKSSIYLLDKYTGVDLDDKKDWKFLKFAWKFKKYLRNL